MLWRLFWHHRWLYLLNAYLILQGWVLVLAPGFITREFFDTLTGGARLTVGVHALAALLVVAHLARLTTLLCGHVTFAVVGITAKALVRTNLLRRILTRPGARALPGSTGEAVSRFRDDADETEGFLAAILWQSGHGLFAVLALATMLRINTTITIVVFVPLVVMVVAAHLASARVAAYRKASREATGRVTGSIGEIFGAVQAVKVANAEDHVIGHFRALSEERRRAGLKDQLLGQVLGATFSGATTVGTGVVLLLAGQAIRAGTFTVGDFALFAYFLSPVTEATREIGTMLARYRQARVSHDRLVDLLQGGPGELLVRPTPVHLRGPLPNTPSIRKGHSDLLETLEVSDLGYHHPGSDRGIAGVDFALRRGTLTVVTGRIGAGKTTLLRVMLGLLPKERGKVEWNGTEVDDPASFLVPPRCAYTPQVPRLFSETLRDNVLLGLPEQRLGAAIRTAVMEHDVRDLENGLDTLVGPRGVKLSGGQLQRAAAARMLVTDSELYVVDDLSSALDVETERALWERLFELQTDTRHVPGGAGQATVLAVSHRRIALQRADHIVVLRNGAVEDAGALGELLARCDEMRRLWAGDVAADGDGAGVAPE